MNNSINYIRHNTPENIVQSFFSGVSPEEDFQLSLLDDCGFTDERGQDFSGSDMLDGIKLQGLWAYADVPHATVHFWIDCTSKYATKESIATMLIHEVAHILDPKKKLAKNEKNADHWAETIVRGLKVGGVL